MKFGNLIHDINLVADRAGLEARIDSNIYERYFGVGKYTMGNIENIYIE